MSIDLGFAQKVDPNLRWKLKNKYFPSKIGGKPIFLDLKYLPKSNDLKCLKCQKMMRFLLQIYCPIDSKDNAFHRTLFVFCCVDNECNQLKVLRSQLSRNNPYYSSEAPDYEKDDLSYDPKPELFGHNLCVVCGLDAKKKCSKCLKVSYCSKEHQIIDWREGNHKQKCGTNDLKQIEGTLNSGVFPELELTIDSNNSDDDSEDNDSEMESKQMEKYNELLEKDCPEYQTKNLDKYEDNVSEDQKVFNRFKRLSSEEVIRYCVYDDNERTEVEPLWISTQNKPNFPIPECQYCGSQRRFEFQVMPQLLHQIIRSEESLDWGTLVVYTCIQSCALEDGYKEEYIWRQNVN